MPAMTEEELVGRYYGDSKDSVKREGMAAYNATEALGATPMAARIASLEAKVTVLE
ncbi:hypothetical protein HGRIS_013946 [Hohenbuehelia grisea]|uniref:Uncharacterized protein n=1 Tax=Hohenbuehelia grisea TaxID=104357 RepID=A0ABR3JS48_9AGAR